MYGANALSGNWRRKKTLNGFYAWVLLDLGEVCFE
jgi:hypothetical protein